MTLDVTQGSVVAVDPEELRALAVRVELAAEAVRRGVDYVDQSTRLQESVPTEVPLLIVRPTLMSLCSGWWHDRALELAASLRLAADAYIALELRTLLAIEGARARTSDGSLVRDELADLAERNPAAMDEAEHLWQAWRASTGDPLVDAWRGAGPAGAAAMTGLLLAMRALRGRFRMGPGSLGETRRARARNAAGPTRPERVVPMVGMAIMGAGSAPRGLADSIARIPNGENPEWGDDARVRVDRYRMSNGDERFAAYISGSRGAPWNTSDPFSWDGNAGLFLGLPESDGYDFVRESLERAGAGPGSVVDVTGFSQGGMVAQRLATDSDFDVQHVTTIGSPLRIPLGDDVTSLTLAHHDDPVAALADGGSPMRLGDEESLLIRRTSDPADTGPFEWDVSAHRVGAYAETARIFEESGDARAASVRAYFDRLSEAASVESFVFRATDPMPGADLGDAGDGGG